MTEVDLLIRQIVGASALAPIALGAIFGLAVFSVVLFLLVLMALILSSRKEAAVITESPGSRAKM